MGEEVGTTYFSYRGPSPHDAASISQAGNRNTVRSVHSVISDRGDNNEITTLAVRPYGGSLHDMRNPAAPPQQSFLVLAPPYPPPGFYPHPPPAHSHQHQQHYPVVNGNGYLTRSFVHLNPGTDDMDDQSIESRKLCSSYSTRTDTLKVCALFMGIIFVLVFGVTIFMAVYFGNSYF